MSEVDLDAVHEKYHREREKRMVASRSALRDLTRDAYFANYTKDPFTPYTERDPIVEEVDVAIVGAGIAGLVTGARLRQAGVDSIRLIDRAGGVGGTWYWNQYPGVMCDVESYIYMPMLEEMHHIPTTRYASGEEIHAHLEAIAQKFDLVEPTLVHTGVERTEWDEASARLVIHTDRGDQIHARFVVMAVGILNLMKLPAIPDMERFQGASFHSARWDYGYTGGGPGQPMTKLRDKAVGVIGTGASAIQCVPQLADAARHVYVFQRTPSAVGVRGNAPTSEELVATFRPGWQSERMDNFTAVMTGRRVERDLTDDGWTHHMAKVANPPVDRSMSPEEILRIAEEVDLAVMDEHRARIEELVTDPRTAEILKPYYRYLCKRPCFHDEYLVAFNRPNVTLVDCPGGVERVTEHGVVVDGEEIALDCIVYATGFEGEVTPFPRRAGHPIIGRGGVTLAERWQHGASTFHGMMSRGFPNLFISPAPGQQAVVSVNHTHVMVAGAEHFAATIARLLSMGVRIADVSEEAEAEWVAAIEGTFVDRSAFMSACTPSRLNFDGHPEKANPRNGNYGGGYGNYFRWRELLRKWREEDDFAGLELDPPATAQ